jgi:murein DD-endopeptidase MepM/ murein hydrolase activator NlpD
MGLLDGTRPNASLDEAAKALEAVLLRQLLSSSGAFRSTGAAGSSLHTDLFVEALAEAVADAGGVGIGRAITASLGGGAPAGTAPGAAPVGGPPLPVVPAAVRKNAAALDVLALVEGPGRITSDYGLRADPFHGETARHRGVDVGAPEGSPILAAADGVVRRAGSRGGYGNAVEIDHGDGTTTLYAHAAELLVREGDRVRRGQEIARVGATGRATGPHLHFEVRKDDRAVSPHLALRIYGERVDGSSEATIDPRSRAP